VCAIWDIRYLDWKADRLETWCVDTDGAPLFFMRQYPYDDHPDLRPTWLDTLLSLNSRYRCVACGALFDHWEDVADHIPPFEDSLDNTLNPPPDTTPWRFNP
jgi:hypothetical protein